MSAVRRRVLSGLGFGVVCVFGEPPLYTLVERDGAWINLRDVDASAPDDDASG